MAWRNMQRHYYQDHHLTLAQHPSETDTRLLVRLLQYTISEGQVMISSALGSVTLEPQLLKARG